MRDVTVFRLLRINLRNKFLLTRPVRDVTV